MYCIPLCCSDFTQGAPQGPPPQTHSPSGIDLQRSRARRNAPRATVPCGYDPCIEEYFLKIFFVEFWASRNSKTMSFFAGGGGVPPSPCQRTRIEFWSVGKWFVWMENNFLRSNSSSSPRSTKKSCQNFEFLLRYG